MNWFNALRAFVWLFPLLPLLRIGYGYYSDWYVNLWMFGYNGHYFWDKLQFPDVYHTNEVIGMPTPIFYGPLFYKLAGLLTVAFGAPLALRLFIFAVTGLQFVLVQRLFLKLSGNRWLALLAASFFNWGIYTLTCLYNRSAVAEFFGIHFATIAWAQLVYVMLDRNLVWKSLDLWSVGFFAVLTAGTHTLTGLMGGTVLFVTFCSLWVFCENRKLVLKGLGVQLFLSVLAMGPWLLVNAKFNYLLNIVQRSKEILVSTEDIDLWWGRFSPWPIDPRTWQMPIDTISTPFLTAQVSVALLILCSVLLFKLRGHLGEFKKYALIIFVGLAGAVGIYSISISPQFWEVAPVSLRIVQFAYRTVTYINLMLAVALIGLVLLSRKVWNEVPVSRNLALGLLALGFLGPLGKIIQSQVVTAPLEDKVQMAHLPPEYAGAVDFGVWYFYERPDFEQMGKQLYETKLVPWYGLNFGTILDSSTEFKEETFLATNVVSFPWNLVLVDAQVPRLFMSSYFLGAVVPPGTHRVTYSFSPSDAYKVLKWVSSLTFFIWLSMLLLTLIRHLILRQNHVPQ